MPWTSPEWTLLDPAPTHPELPIYKSMVEIEGQFCIMSSPALTAELQAQLAANRAAAVSKSPQARPAGASKRGPSK